MRKTKSTMECFQEVLSPLSKEELINLTVIFTYTTVHLACPQATSEYRTDLAIGLIAHELESIRPGKKI